jgi:hypothetical protein
MWLALIPLLSNLFGESGPLAAYLKTKADKVQADAELALQVQKDKLTLSTTMAQAEVTSESNKLAATSQGFKSFSYALLTLPIIIVCIYPSLGKEIFANLSVIPSWYAQLYVAVVGVIWGLPIASSAVSGIFSAVQSSWLERQPLKIEKVKVLNEQILATELRKTLFKNGMTQEQWDAILNATKTAES